MLFSNYEHDKVSCKLFVLNDIIILLSLVFILSPFVEPVGVKWTLAVKNIFHVSGS